MRADGLDGAARRRLQELAATSSEFAALASAAWNLGLVVRYGDVRRFDAGPLVPLVEALLRAGRLGPAGRRQLRRPGREAYDAGH